MPVPDYADDRPVYIQIADDLRARIRSGEYGPGDRLPSIADLSQRYHVARETIRQALDMLRDEKLVVAQSTRGVFVLKEPPTDDAAGEQSDIEVLGEQVAQLQDEVREHARLLARMRRRLEEAGITLADKDQRDEHAV